MKGFPFLVAIAWGLLPQIALSCTTCYGPGGADSPTARGMGMAILFLLGVTGMVLGGILGFVFYLWRRSRILSHLEDSDSDAMGFSPLLPPYASHGEHSPMWRLTHSGLASGRAHHHASSSRGGPGLGDRFHPGDGSSRF